MNVVRSEIRTGLLVILTVGVLVAILVYLSAPGVFRKMNHYGIYFDDAGGIQLGAPVMLAGRRVGQVVRLYSPVAESERPSPGLEVIVDVDINADAHLYQNARVFMVQFGLLGEQVIDIVGGSERFGLAESGYRFIGKREPGLTEAVPKVLEKLDPMVKTATRTLAEINKSAVRLTQMTAKGAELDSALIDFRKVGGNVAALSGTGGVIHRALDHLSDLTSESSPLAQTLRNTEDLTGNLAKNKDIEASLANFRKASQTLKQTAQGLQGTVQEVRPGLDQTIHNATQFTDTIKHQPWRLIWPTTKKYPEDKRAQAVYVTASGKRWRPLWASSTPPPSVRLVEPVGARTGRGAQTGQGAVPPRKPRVQTRHRPHRDCD